MHAVKSADLDGNGVDDTIPILANASGESSNPFVTFRKVLGVIWTDTAAYPNYLDPADNKIKPINVHPELQNYTLKMREWYAEGLIYQDQFNLSMNTMVDLIVSNKVAVVLAWTPLIRAWEDLLRITPEADYEIVELTTLSGGPFKYSMQKGFGRPQIGVVYYSPVVKEAMQLYNWMFADNENYLCFKQGVPNVHWQWIDKENITIDATMNGTIDRENPESTFNFGLSVYGHTKWIHNRAPGLEGLDWYTNEVRKASQFISEEGKIWDPPPDWMVVYNFVGTSG